MNIGVNLFGADKWMKEDFHEDAKRLKEIGFASIEPDIIFTTNVEGMEEKLNEAAPYIPGLIKKMWSDDIARKNIKIAREAGLNVISVHLMLCQLFDDALLKMVPAIIDFGKEFKIKYFVVSYSASTIKNIEKYIPYLQQASTALKEAGMLLLYHNHDSECAFDNGVMVLEYILEQCPDLMLQIDIGWVQFAGVSVVDLVNKHKDRLVLLHLKDIKEDASLETRDTCYTAIGAGSVPTSEVLRMVGDYGLDEDAIIIDQDDSQGDIFDDYLVGIRNIVNMVK